MLVQSWWSRQSEAQEWTTLTLGTEVLLCNVIGSLKFVSVMSLNSPGIDGMHTTFDMISDHG